MSKTEKQNIFAKRQFVDTPREIDDHDTRAASVKEKLQKRREAADKILNKQEFRKS